MNNNKKELYTICKTNRKMDAAGDVFEGTGLTVSGPDPV